FGCLLGSILLVDEARRRGYAPKDTLAVLMVAYAGGLLGAALIPLLQGLGLVVREGHFSLRSGFAAYGGLIGGTVSGIFLLRRLGVPVLPFLDAAAPTLALGYFFARIGCLMAGCDYGIPTAQAFGIAYPPGSSSRSAPWRRWSSCGCRALGGPMSVSTPEQGLARHIPRLALAFALLVGALWWTLASSPPDERRDSSSGAEDALEAAGSACD